MAANIPLKEVSSDASLEKADKVIIYADAGLGKSFSVATSLIDAPEDRRIIYLMTERNAAIGFENGLKHYNIKPKEGQIIYVFPKQKKKAFTNLSRSLKAFVKESKKDSLKGNADTTQGTEHYTYLQDIITTLEDFTGTDYVTGEEVKVGNVAILGSQDILVVDGLSPIGLEVWNSVVGDKIAISMTDYSQPQRLMHIILNELSILTCPVILLAHEKPLTDDKGNLIQLRVNTFVGNANYATLMGLFTDVIHATKVGPTFRWEVSKPGVYTVSRRITGQSQVEPNFSKHGFFTGK
ncbi:MAG: hypothetical protein WC967_13600 [Balneolaceae bacterium]